VLDDSFHRVEGFDTFLLYLHTGRSQAEGTTEAYAQDLALFETWRVASGRA